jgi:SAM-dependent methyltransferase
MKRYYKSRLAPFFSIFFLIYGPYSFAHNNQDGDTAAKKLDAVEHKNRQLDLYLDLIRYNTQEKIGILPYILDNPQGVYLEIGTGGDPIAEMLSQIPATSPVTLIASDIEEEVLRALPKRHPKLQKYLNAKKGPKLQLTRLDATDMRTFNDSFLNGINASSVVHEIISYAGGMQSMEKFFQEACRTLKLGGVLVYRDPECVRDMKEIVTLSLKIKNIRLFAHIFLYKFLDKRGSVLAKSGRKIEIYQPENLTFTFFKKDASAPSSLTYEEYLKVPSYDIDFARKYTITLPCGLYRELARHYLTYLHQCNPLVFAKCTPEIFSGHYTINYFAHSTKGLLFNFFEQGGSILENGKINSNQKIKLDQHIEDNARVLEFGIPLHLKSQKIRCTLRGILERHDLLPCNYLINVNKNSCLLDYRIFGLLYDEISQTIFDEFNGVVNKKDEEHAKWLKREGEEFYFYMSTDELITTVLKTTQAECVDEQGNKKVLALCPLSADNNEFVERICYSELLKYSLDIRDTLGYEMNISDGKRVIHFAKMPLQKAIAICKEIINQDPLAYKNLRSYIESLKKKISIGD